MDIVSCCTSSIDPVFKTAWLEPGMHVTDVTGMNRAGLWRCRGRAGQDGESTPHIENPPPGAFYAAHGFLGYVAGQPEEKTIIPKRPPREEILKMPSLADLLSGKVKGRINDQQTSWFLNLGVMGVQFAAVCTAVYNEARKRGSAERSPPNGSRNRSEIDPVERNRFEKEGVHLWLPKWLIPTDTSLKGRDYVRVS